MSKTVKERLEQLRSRLPENSQKGFTLIELLVVVSILGILAAVVTLSLVGLQNKANQQAQSQELATVQTAFDTDIQDNNLDPAQACGPFINGNATSNMQALPSGGPFLYPKYIHEQSSKWQYWCSDPGSGTLAQK
ncbi:MAG: type II secretion system protein [Acidimicrobiaceae bacterium]|nr:type II secretion system protein [Acidimicrobiaceae bacterium]